MTAPPEVSRLAVGLEMIAKVLLANVYGLLMGATAASPSWKRTS
ncbi:hypothetical protein ACFWM5_20810 [Streptomyces bobili]